ncbi:MAG: alpha/beta hydrolase fold domain-containing protein, partial [Gammaproteobacteria bacterium]
MRPTIPHPGDSREASVEVRGAGTVGLRIHDQPRTRHGAPVVLYFHGGAFTCGGAATPTALVSALHAAGAVVAAIDYPLAPAHPFPQAVEAGYAALCWLQRERVALTGCRSALLVAGEEAGGNLAAAAALMARDRLEPKLSGTILLSPMLDPCVGTASLRRTRAGPVGCKWADGWTQYLANPADVDHPYAVPASALRQSGL